MDEAGNDSIVKQKCVRAEGRIEQGEFVEVDAERVGNLGSGIRFLHEYK